MTRILYIGNKPVKTDNVAHSGYIWNGEGDVQDVPEPAARKLLAHPTVWVLESEQADAGKTTVQQVAELDALRERAAALGIKVNGTWGVPRLTKAIDEAEAAAKQADAGKTGQA